MNGEGEDNDGYTEKSFALETRSFASETNAVPPEVRLSFP